MSLKHSSTSSLWPVSQAWPVSKPSGTLVLVCREPVSLLPYPSLIARTTRSWFVRVRRLRIGGQHRPLFIHATCAGGVREIRQTGAPCTSVERSSCWLHIKRKRNRSEFTDCVCLSHRFLLRPHSKRPPPLALLQQYPLGHSLGVRIQRKTPTLGIVMTVSKMDCPIGATPNELVPYFSGLVSFSGPRLSC